jgi:diacylglycerol kinase family enzyme
VSPIDLPTITWRALSRRARVARHHRIQALSGMDRFSVRSVDGHPLPLQVDGDYIGEVEAVEFGVIPGGLRVVA